MAQASDNTVDNGTGAAVRSDINSRLAALYTNHSGTTDTTMVTKYAYQTWADTTADQLKLRNSSNDAWIPLRGLNGDVISSSGVVGTPGIRFASDTGTGFYRVGTNIFGFASNQTKLFEVGRDLGTPGGEQSFLWNTTTNPNGTNTASDEGVQITQRGKVHIGQESRTCVVCNRINTDGQLMAFEGQGTQEGEIRVDGTTVSFNGGHLSRWSQLPGNASRIQILRGSVLTNVNEMCEWGDEDNEQLNRMEVSTVEGDANVAGVFQCWDDDDEVYTKDFICAMTGDFVIRIAQDTVVSRGDLLMSAGDGTAKPQGDDIVRSKTIAKVTSTTVSATYSDGSYCVPCVLMAC
tara:strand:- start:1583 stop:2629 length:1047 start_codon:yes stop_codon:yes gene_type:complete